MVSKKKTTAASKKLKLKKETIKDLQPRGKAIKGGGAFRVSMACAGRPGGQDGTTMPTAGTQTLGLGCQTVGCGIITH